MRVMVFPGWGAVSLERNLNLWQYPFLFTVGASSALIPWSGLVLFFVTDFSPTFLLFHLFFLFWLPGSLL